MLRVIALLVLGGICASCSAQSPPLEAATSSSVDHSSHASIPHGDHSAHYGGTVYMKGDLHFEVVLDRAGAHRVYFSDATRAELPASTASEVTLTISGGGMRPETLNARVDEAGESWETHGSPLRGPDVTARVAFVINDEPYWIDVPYIPGAGSDHAAP